MNKRKLISIHAVDYRLSYSLIIPWLKRKSDSMAPQKESSSVVHRHDVFSVSDTSVVKQLLMVRICFML